MLETPFLNYFGGKSNAGVYQTIINHIPPHRVFMTLFAGNCGVLKHIRPAETTIINDLDLDVTKAWDATGISLKGGYEVYNTNAFDWFGQTGTLQDLQWYRQKEHVFIYLDPPYLFSARKGQLPIYKHELTEKVHEGFLTDITAYWMTGYKVMISHYPCDLYDKILLKKNKWNYTDFNGQIRQGPVIERIYYNYALDGRLHDYQYIGKDFREREKFKRIKTNWFAKLDKMEPLLRNSMLQEYEHRTGRK